MGFTTILTSILSLFLVLGLIALISVVLRKYGTERIVGTKTQKEKRLNIQEIKVIDQKNKLLLISRDEKEHLLIVGVNGTTLIETVEDKPEK